MGEEVYPWIFRRDELDLLEDELEDLFDVHDQDAEPATFESLILKEQLFLQECSDRELSQRLGFDVSQEAQTMFDTREPVDLQHSQELFQRVQKDALYLQARDWFYLLNKQAKREYERGEADAAQMFEVYASTFVVPLKIFTSLTQSGYGDRVGLEIAEEEYRLVLYYLDKILQVMKGFLLRVDLLVWAQPIFQKTQMLYQNVLIRYTQVQEQKKHL